MTRHKAAFALWLLCGTLDIAYAAGASVAQGGAVASMLRAVASGPFGDGARDWGLAGAMAGLGVHFAIMGAMVAAWFAATRRWGALTQRRGG